MRAGFYCWAAGGIRESSKDREWGKKEKSRKCGSKMEERERNIGGRGRKRTKVWGGGGWGGDAEVGSGACRLSGVCYLWSKCTLAFLLSTPQMQLDSLLAKQTQMKWLLNDFLSNPPRQHKPSIWSLLFPSLSPRLFSPFLQTLFPHFSLDSFCRFSCVFLFDLLFLWSPLSSIFSRVNPCTPHLFSWLHSFTNCPFNIKSLQEWKQRHCRCEYLTFRAQ